MQIMSFRGVLAGFLCLMASEAVAQVSTYDCNVSSLEKRGFISPRLFFSIDTEQSKAAVFDGIVRAAYDNPVAADFEQLSNGQLRLKWKVRNLKSGSTSLSVDYRLQFRPQQRTFSIRANVKGWDNRPTGQGTCKLITEASLFDAG